MSPTPIVDGSFSHLGRLCATAQLSTDSRSGPSSQANKEGHVIRRLILSSYVFRRCNALLFSDRPRRRAVLRMRNIKKLNGGTKALLAAAGLFAAAAPLRAQTVPTTLTFDVASVKLAPPPAGPNYESATFRSSELSTCDRRLHTKLRPRQTVIRSAQPLDQSLAARFHQRRETRGLAAEFAQAQTSPAPALQY
jgi:hypothetical protein